MSNGQHDDRLELDELDERLRAVERALTDGDGDGHGSPAALGDADGTALADLRERLDDLEAQVTDLDAATQALRGYVGNVRSVDRDIERRADAALSKVESLEAELEEDVGGSGDGRSREVPTGVERDRTADAAASRPDRCDHCGAAHDDGTGETESHQGVRTHRDGLRGSAETGNPDPSDQRSRTSTGGERRQRNQQTADSERSEWDDRVATAGDRRGARDGRPTAEGETDDDSGLFASLRESL